LHRRADHTEDFDRYRHLSACFTCPLKPQCTPTKLRLIKRGENEDVLDKMQARLDRMPEAMGVRRQTVEHPFGTLKAWLGATHFLTRTLDKVRTEMSLHVLAYNQLSCWPAPLQQVGAADNTREPAVTDHWNTLDLMTLQ
jgi:Transposase DDE domain